MLISKLLQFRAKHCKYLYDFGDSPAPGSLLLTTPKEAINRLCRLSATLPSLGLFFLMPLPPDTTTKPPLARSGARFPRWVLSMAVAIALVCLAEGYRF
jgi:hypothetical protein